MQAVKATGMAVVTITPRGGEKYRDACDRNWERLEAWGARHAGPQRVEPIERQTNDIEGALRFRVQES